MPPTLPLPLCYICMLPILGTSFEFFLLSTPDKCTCKSILCILDSDVFSYYSTRLGVKRACFIPLVTECYINYLCYMLCSVVKLKKAMHACR